MAERLVPTTSEADSGILHVNKWKQFKTSLLLVYLVFVLAILGARGFTDPVKPYTSLDTERFIVNQYEKTIKPI